VTFIEVKSRAAAGHSEELANRVVDQIDATEQVMRDLFFRRDPRRLDHVLQRSRLATLLRFYLERAWRHNLITSEERRNDLEAAIARLESGIPEMRVERRGFIVNLAAQPEPPIKIRDSTIQLVTARDVAELGMATEFPPAEQPEPEPEPEPAARGDEDGAPPEASVARTAVEPNRGAHGHVNHEPVTATSTAESEDERETPTSPSVRGKTSEERPTPDAGATAPPEVTSVLGRTTVDQTEVVWKASVRGSPHLFILGIPGQGKSWTVTRLLLELTRQNVPALVFDFHGQFAEATSPYALAASPAVLDAAQGLPFSPFEAEWRRDAGTSYWQTNAFVVAEIFEYVCGLGDIQRDVVYEAIRDCYQAVGFEAGEPSRLPTVAEVAARLEELAEERRVRNVVPRCRPLLEFGLFSDEDATRRGEREQFQDLMRRGAVLDVSRQGLEELQLAAGAFVLRKVYKEMFLWGETDRLRLVVVLDEAHRLARDITLPKIMKEGRKFGLAVVVASQNLADFHADVIGNAGTKVIFRTNFPMSKKVGGFLRVPAQVDLAAAIEQLDVGEAFVQTPEMSTAARVRMAPLSA
jgi:DNA phosphorothioation-dependent restriction protein DptH